MDVSTMTPEECGIELARIHGEVLAVLNDTPMAFAAAVFGRIMGDHIQDADKLNHYMSIVAINALCAQGADTEHTTRH